MKILQINTTANTGSTGRIAEDLGRCIIGQGGKSYIAYGRAKQESVSSLIKIGSNSDIQFHGLQSLLFDRHGFGSVSATKKFVQHLEEIKPDIIHLHNLHGYYLNVRVLFDYLERIDIPVVWTLHDCWPFTGHCSYFDVVGCERWITGCYTCPNRKGYPKSLFIDRSVSSYRTKRELFTKMKRMVMVTPSNWLADHVRTSFLGAYPVQVIHNGVALDRFKSLESSTIRKKFGLGIGAVVLGVASIWDKRKGFDDFLQLRALLDGNISIVLVGLSLDQIKRLPEGIIGIRRTENIEELAALYSAADVFVNPTWVDNFPTTNIEALACGSPVVTYNTGGSPEAISEDTGIVVPKGDVRALQDAVKTVIQKGKNAYRDDSIERAVTMFDSKKRYQDYLDLYDGLMDGRV